MPAQKVKPRRCCVRAKGKTIACFDNPKDARVLQEIIAKTRTRAACKVQFGDK